MGTTENCFSSQSSKKTPCQTAPQTGASLQRKRRAHVQVNNSLLETISVSLARFKSRCKVPLPVTFCEFPQELRIRDTINMSFGTFHKWLERERPSCPETFRYVLPENQRLPCVVRARSVWRCATPCCLPALSFSARSAFYRDLHIFRRSSRKVCSSRSMAVGGARPYLRSASV